MDNYERILSESFQLFVKFGIKSITMDDIAKHIGISKKTIYENFRDKNDLLKQGLLYHKNIQDTNIKLVIANSENVLEAIYKVMFEASKHMHKINPSFFTDLKKYHHKICEEFVPRNQKEKMEITLELINKGVNEGIFRNDFNIEMITKLLLYQMNILSDENMFANATYSKSDVFRTIIENFTRGIATPKGLSIIEDIIEKNKENKQL